MKAVKWILLLLVLAGIGWVAWKWYDAKGIPEEAFSYVPPDVIYCIAVDDPIETWKTIFNSNMWRHMQTNSYFGAMTKSIQGIDSLIKENGLISDLLGSQPVLVSAHISGIKQYDFLFLVDLQEVSGIKFLNDYLSNFTASGYKVRKEKYADQDLIVMNDPHDNSNLYISMPGTYLLASYSRRVITSSLDYHQSGSTESVEKLMRGSDLLEKGSMIKLLLNYEMLPNLMSCYTSEKNEYVSRLAEALVVSRLNISFDEDMIRGEGVTIVNDSVESYLKTFANSGSGTHEYFEIVPQRAALVVGLGFSSFGTFFDNFQKDIQQDVTEYESYMKNLKQVENFLDIDIRKNLINWIGDEVALLEMPSSGLGKDNEVAVVLKASNIQLAKTNLTYVEKQVRKRTPVKFKSVDHHGYEIKYLHMKGVFKVLFGKFFERYDKPYYTILNNFVIFSSHPQTLQSIIDDYLENKTLNRSPDFRKFMREFEDDGAVFVYVHTPALYSTMQQMVDTETRTSMTSNKDYITCFRDAGFQMIPADGGYKTLVAEQFVEPEISDQPIGVPYQKIDLDTIPDTTDIDENEAEEDPMELPYIYVQNLNAKMHTDYYPDSVVRFTVELKNGFKHGDYKEYYENGKVKMTGSFKSDKRDGVWKRYDEGGKLMMRRVYDEGEVKKERL